jgi:biotin synthase-like enzyme
LLEGVLPENNHHTRFEDRLETLDHVREAGIKVASYFYIPFGEVFFDF